MVETGTLLQNRYLIERQIGEGGMGAVYLAVDQRFGSSVAIKETFYKEDNLGEAFEREARLLNSLHHPILPHVSDYFTEGSGHFLVMEFIEGEDLSEILKREGAFPVAEVLRWTDELLDALDYLHSQQPPIVHRDIKPNNLKLTTRGNIVLLDFGLAKLSSSDQSGVKSVFGYSRTYSPLEQIQGTGTDARSDIFALGATAYHLLTGTAPLDALARAAAIVAGKPDPLRLASEINLEIPVAVAQILQTALALNAERRFVSANAMRKALEFAVNAEARSEQVAALAIQYSGAVANENFPALASFAAAAAAQNSQNLPGGEPVQIKIPIVKTPSEAPKIVPPAVSADEPVFDSGARKNHLLKIVASAFLLLGGVFAVWYATGGAKSSDEPSSAAPALNQQPTSSVNSKQPEEASASLSPKTSPESVNDQDTQAKTASLVKESKADSQKKVNDSTTSETVKTAPPRSPNRTAETPPSRSESAPNPVRSGAQRPRVVEPPAETNVIVVGESAAAKQQRADRRQQRREQRLQRRELTQAEKDELRRRRTEDILRQNRQPIAPQ